MKNDFKKVLKIIVAGDGGIGKTTYLKYLCYSQFLEDQTLTVGNEIFLKKLKIDGRYELFLQIWDCGGQDRFRSFLVDFFRGAAGALIGFDVKRRKSFLDLKEWVNLLRMSNPELPIVLMATKTDLGYHPTLNPSLASKFAEEFNLIGFVELSTKEKINVEKPFKLLIKHIENCSEEDIQFVSYQA